jgi:hypothetical protein
LQVAYLESIDLSRIVFNSFIVSAESFFYSFEDKSARDSKNSLWNGEKLLDGMPRTGNVAAYLSNEHEPVIQLVTLHQEGSCIATEADREPAQGHKDNDGANQSNRVVLGKVDVLVGSHGAPASRVQIDFEHGTAFGRQRGCRERGCREGTEKIKRNIKRQDMGDTKGGGPGDIPERYISLVQNTN